MEEEEKKPTYRHNLNPRPNDLEAIALPLRYNRVP